MECRESVGSSRAAKMVKILVRDLGALKKGNVKGDAG